MRYVEYDDDSRESYVDYRNEQRMRDYVCPECSGSVDGHAANCPNNEEDESCQ